jgi:hypothetical protein
MLGWNAAVDKGVQGNAEERVGATRPEDDGDCER